MSNLALLEPDVQHAKQVIYQAGEKARDDMPGWDVLSLIRTEAVTRKVNYMGVKLHKQWYWDNALRHMVGEDVTVRYSKEDELTVTIVKNKRLSSEWLQLQVMRYRHKMGLKQCPLGCFSW